MTDRQIFKLMSLVVLSVFALVAMWEFVIEGLIWPHILTSYAQQSLSHRWEYTFVAPAFAAIALIFPTQLLRSLNRRSNRAAQALRTSEAQMRLVTDALPALIGYFDTEQRLQFVNKTFESWYEVPRDEIVGRKIRDVMAEYIAEADYERFRPYVETALSGEEVHFEELVTYPDGKTRNVWVTYVPEFGSGGSIEGAFAFIQDITERKRMEDAVRESEARLSAIIDNAPNAISLKDRRGHYLLINRVFEEMLDTTSEEVRGKTSPEIFPAEFAESGVAHDRAVIEKRCAIEREEELVLGDRAYTYLTTKFPIRDASGDIVSIGAIHTDITERKRSEDALRESETRLRDAARLAKLGQYVWDDLAEKCIYCDEEYARIYGVSVAEYLSTYATVEADLEWAHPADRERYRDVVFTEASEHRGAIDIEYRIVRRDGETRYIHELGTPVLDEEGALIRTIGTIQDVTDRKRAEEDLRKALDELEVRVEERTSELRAVNAQLLEEIAERERVEKELRASEARYREIFDDAPGALWVEDWSRIKQIIVRLTEEGAEDWRAYFEDHRDRVVEIYDLAEVLQISNANLDLFGAMSVRELDESSWAATVRPEELDAFVEVLLGFIAGRWSGEAESLDDKMDGTKIVLRTRYIIPPKYRHDWSRVIYSLEDITERKRAEEALRQARDELELRVEERTADLRTTNQVLVDEIDARKRSEDEMRRFQTHLAHASRLNMMGEMAAGLAHELNQPLTVISSYAQRCLTSLYDDKTTPDDLDNALQQIVTQSARASEIISRIRKFISKAKPPVASIDVNAAIGVAYDLLLGEARSSGVTVRLDLAEPSPMAVIDAIELQQVVLNLARNGIEAMTGNGSDHRELIIRTAKSELSQNDGEAPVEVTVRDTGPGISSEIQNRVFDPFFTTKADGLGLGLSICHSIISRYNGRLWLGEDDEAGTAFHFSVPAG